MYRLLSLLLCLLAAPAVADIWPQPERLAVAVNRRTADDNLDAALANALARYMDFYLSSIGHRVTFAASDIDSLDLQHMAADSGCDMLLLVDVSGDLKRHTTLQVLERRRHRFITVDGLLELNLRYSLTELRDDTWREIAHGRVSEKADPNWIKHFPSPIPKSLQATVAAMPEPIEYVLQRCVQRTIDEMSFRSRDVQSPPATQSSVPVAVVVDQSFVTKFAGMWPGLARQTLATASDLYHAEFDIVLRETSIAPTRLPLNGLMPIRDLYNALSLQFANRHDSLILTLYASPNPLHHILGRDHEEIGLSTTGGNLILVRDLPIPGSIDSRWSALFTGLNFAHELGHRYGAIHVSDPGSLMNHSLSWMVPGRMDQLNRSIISAALNKQLDPSDSIAYAIFVAEAIDSTGYSLADFPPVFYRILPTKGNTSGPKSPLARVKPVYFLAAQAYGHLIHGELSTAAELFRKAIALAPDQASLHFYLANCSGGDESQSAWQTAANLGYWQAQIAGAVNRDRNEEN